MKVSNYYNNTLREYLGSKTTLIDLNLKIALLTMEMTCPNFYINALISNLAILSAISSTYIITKNKV